MAAVRAAALRMKVPSLNGWFRPRAEVQEQVADRLTAESGSDRARLLGLVGMGGSGKTMLAQAVALAFAGDEGASRGFEHGVIWMQAGSRSPEACQAELLRALGEPDPPLDELTGAGLLRALFHGTRCLLVIDDVQSSKQWRALHVVGDGGAVLFTTRDHEPVPGNCRYDVPALSRDEARALLAVHAGAGLPAGSEEIVEEIIQRCGGLPLALAICGAMTGPDCSWADVAALLRRPNPAALQATFDDLYKHTSLWAAIDASVERLDKRTRKRYENLAVFAGRGPVPVAAAARLWGRGPQYDAADALAFIKQFASRSLLTYRADDRTFVLHDLLYKYVLYQARHRLTALHGRMAAAYQGEWGTPGAGFPGLNRSQPLDVGTRYGVINVPRHLAQAGLDDPLHKLLTAEQASDSEPRDAWFAVHDETHLEEEYLTDLDLARRRAEREADTAAPGARARNLALEVRYSLIRSLLADMAALPAGVLAALTASGAWPFDTAMAYAEMIPDPFHRVDALIALARLPRRSKAELTRITGQVEAAVPKIQQPIDQIYATAFLAEFAPDEQASCQFFDQALEMVEDAYKRRAGAVHHDGHYREVRAKLLAHMATDADMAEALRVRAARMLLEGVRSSLRLDHSYRDELTKAMPLLEGLPCSQELSDEVVRIARRACSRGEDHEAEALATRLRYAPPGEKGPIIEEMLALHDRLGLRDEDDGPRWPQWDREYLVCQLADHLEGGALGVLTESTLERASTGGTIRVLEAILPRLPDVQQEKARAAAAAAIRRKGTEIRRKPMAEMAALMKVVTGPLRAELIQETFERLHRADPSHAVLLLGALDEKGIPLPEPLLRRAASSRLNSRALGRLAPLLPRDLLDIAVSSLRRLPGDAEGWAGALTSLAPALPDTDLPVVLDLIRDVSSSEKQVELLTSLADCLPPGLIGAAAQAVPTDVGGSIPVAELMATLAGRATGELGRSLFQQAKDAACSTRLCDTPFRAMIRDAEDADELLRAVRLVSALMSPAWAQAASRDPLDEKLALRALGIAQDVSSPCSQTGYLATLVGYVPEQQRAAVLREAVRAALLPHHRNDGPCGLHGLDDAARLVPWPDRLPLTMEAAEVLAAGGGGNEWMRRLLCLVIYHPGPDGGEYRDRAVQCLPALKPPGDELVSPDLYSALRILAPYISPDGTLASAEASLARHLPAEAIPTIIWALDEYRPHLGHAAPALRPGDTSASTDPRLRISEWRALMQGAAGEGQSAFLAFIAGVGLPDLEDTSDTSRQQTARFVAQQMLSVRRSWLTTSDILSDIRRGALGIGTGCLRMPCWPR